MLWLSSTIRYPVIPPVPGSRQGYNQLGFFLPGKESSRQVRITPVIGESKMAGSTCRMQSAGTTPAG
jgi:hypothetical protein